LGAERPLAGTERTFYSTWLKKITKDAEHQLAEGFLS
jgi:hypothetical protein